MLPSSIVSIGIFAFANCDLRSMTIPNSVTSIGVYAFHDCTRLTNIAIPNSVTSIPNGTFSHCGLTSITIPDSVTSIGEGAFAGCIGLANKLGLVIVRNTLFDCVGAAKDVIIPNTVTSISDDV